MTRLHLKYVQSYRGYHYFRRRGSPYIIPGIVGSAEFTEAISRRWVLPRLAIGSKRSVPGSVSAAIAQYYGSQAFRSLTGGTPAMRRPPESHNVDSGRFFQALAKSSSTRVYHHWQC